MFLTLNSMSSMNSFLPGKIFLETGPSEGSGKASSRKYRLSQELKDEMLSRRRVEKMFQVCAKFLWQEETCYMVKLKGSK